MKLLTIGIIGWGRFAKILTKYLLIHLPQVKILVSSRQPNLILPQNIKQVSFELFILDGVTWLIILEHVKDIVSHLSFWRILEQVSHNVWDLFLVHDSLALNVNNAPGILDSLLVESLLFRLLGFWIRCF